MYRTSTAACTAWATTSTLWPWSRRLGRWWMDRRSGTMMGPCPCAMVPLWALGSTSSTAKWGVKLSFRSVGRSSWRERGSGRKAAPVCNAQKPKPRLSWHRPQKKVRTRQQTQMQKAMPKMRRPSTFFSPTATRRKTKTCRLTRANKTRSSLTLPSERERRNRPRAKNASEQMRPKSRMHQCPRPWWMRWKSLRRSRHLQTADD
mmetsp:Transcript_70889/g.156397  ORF Transcript_70889/g.156397 Transcript_70889/m.156397 type:complete len:204 (+) Transcript_70889:64-675(+)